MTESHLRFSRLVGESGGTVDLADTTVTGLRWIEQFSGQYRGSDADLRGWASVGPFDDIFTVRLGSHTATSLSWLAGGFIFPHTVQLRRVYAEHRVTQNAAEAFGFVVFGVVGTVDTDTATTTFYRHETQENGDVGPRNYGSSNELKIYDDDLTGVTAAQSIPAYTRIGVGVAMPSAAADRNIQIMGGFMEFERPSA